VRELNVIVENIPDTDGDGICDNFDIDDDNDGILDVDEALNCNTVPSAVFGSLQGPHPEGGSDINNPQIGDSFRYNNVYSGVDAIVTFDSGVGTTIDNIDLIAGTLNDNFQPVFTYANASAFVDISIEFVFSNTTTPVDLTTYFVTVYDNDYVEIVGFDDTVVTDVYIDTPSHQNNYSGFGAPYTGHSFQADGTPWNSDINDARFQITGIYHQTNIVKYRLSGGTARQAFHSLGFSACYPTNNWSNPPALIAGYDTDGDGIDDYLDLDSDNDGISDLRESRQEAATVDANNNGVLDDMEGGAPNDADNDGLSDASETRYGANTGANPFDTDLDGIPDIIDLDSDNDGIPDTVELELTAGYTTNDGDVTNDDSDGDGVIDAYDSTNGHGANFTIPVDTDGAYYPDYQDIDSDLDILSDFDESGLTPGVDANGDGIGDGVGASYADPDGIVNNPQTDLANQSGDTSEVGYREALDSDGDNIIDEVDIDDDNDGIPDIEEGCGNLIQNASFEDDDFTDGSKYHNSGAYGAFIGANYNADVLRGWGYTVNTDGWREGSFGGSYDHAPAFHGTQYMDVLGNMEVYGTGSEVFMTPPNVLSQNIPTIVGNTYTVSFFWGEDRGHDAGENVTLHFGVLDSGGTSLVNQTLTKVADGINGNSKGPNTWYLHEASFVATTTITKIQFQADPPDYNPANPNDGTGNDLSAGAALDYVSVRSSCTDTDGDLIPDSLDLDSDGDGIYDIVEAGNVAIDANHNGIVDDMEGGAPNDTNNYNGLSDSLEAAIGSGDVINYTIPNTDGTGEPDFQDVDADDDGILDNIEGQSTPGYDTPVYQDVDNNGVDDDYDTHGTWINPIDTDGDNVPDYLDLDSDHDGDSDALEGWDTDNDGVADTVPTGNDADNDGWDDAYDPDDASPTPIVGGPVGIGMPNLDIPATEG